MLSANRTSREGMVLLERYDDDHDNDEMIRLEWLSLPPYI
jgi:hypothetical protein